ncbi:hypothetical protein K440DRAFT_26451 [Wilcoxina mikolae CBS 423.85]|nr:hypothetical protein K440DRAFT_26451 [Wilcoxina mikolae CBS 423.85]
MSVGNSKSESTTKDVDISTGEEMSQLLESDDTTPSSEHQSSSFPQDNTMTTDMSSIQSEVPESKTISDIHKSVATLPLSLHRESQMAEQSASPYADVIPPKDLDPKRPSQETEPLPSLPGGGKPETEHRAISGPSEQRFDLTKLTRAVASLLESECPSLLHDHRFNNPNIRARYPQEFDELKYEGSPIKPGVLNILSLIDVCL